MTNEIKERIYNIELAVIEIQKFPQTYKTLLGEFCNDGTCNIILRRKLNRLCKEGEICKTNIPGTRFGKAIFYALPKKYYILVEAGRIGSNVFVFFEYKKLSRFYIKVDELWQLRNGMWNVEKDKTFFEGNILKFI